MQENKDNEKFVDATKSKVQNVTDLYCSIDDKIKDRITHLQTALYRCQGFSEALEEFERWLSDAERKFQALGVMTIRPNIIKKQGAGLKVSAYGTHSFFTLNEHLATTVAAPMIGWLKIIISRSFKPYRDFSTC